ncbi:hypothetical protein [Parasphingorhabdus pacifica]
MNSYQHILEMVESAASYAEDDSVSVVSAGGDCRQRSVRLITHMNDLCVELKLWIKYFEANAEVE